MAKAHQPLETSVTPAVEQGGGARSTGTASAGRGNQARIDALPPTEPDCALGDDEACGLEVSLDEILGEGALADILEVQAQITALSRAIFQRLASIGNQELTTKYAEHTDGALNLNRLLDGKGVALQASAAWDENGELTWDYALEMQLLVVQGRAETAIDVLTAVEKMLDAKSIEPLLDGILAFRQMGAGALDALRIRAESGWRQLEMLLGMYEKRKESFEANRAVVLKQAASMSMARIDQLFEAKDRLKRAWTIGNALLAVGKLSEGGSSPWETLKRVKSVGFAAMSEYTRLLVKDDPFRLAFGELSTLVNTCQLIVDLGPTMKDARLMYELAETAMAVRDEYAADTSFYLENRAAIEAQLAGLGAFAAAAEAVDAQASAAEAIISSSGASSPGFYHPFN